MPLLEKVPSAVRIVRERRLQLRVIVIALCILFVTLAAFLFWLSSTLPDVSHAQDYVPAGTIEIFDRFDRLACAVEDGESREKVRLDQISNYAKWAALASEDRQFFEHGGVNPASIARAALANIQAGKLVQGGSTITQQLAKNLFLEPSDRSIGRKIKESILAIKLEHAYTKDEILEMYLNQVYFGRNAYGIERAAARYFNKSASKLTLPESAFLVGLIKAPSVLGVPGSRQAFANQRRVLAAMTDTGFITAEQEEAARKAKLRFQKGVTVVQKYPYYVQYVLKLLHGRLSKADQADGLRVYTYMDTAAQQAAEKSLSRGIASAPSGVTQGALAAVSVIDGGVLALVGGVGDFYENQWNRATNPHTIGSAFKPFVYLAAFDAGAVTPDTTIKDEPITVFQKDSPPYQPKNFDEKFRGPMTVREALAISRNTCAVKVAMMTGTGKVINMARQAGLQANLSPFPSMALGASAAAPLDMAAAYATFARGGTRIAPQVIRRIVRRDGSTIKSYGPRPRDANVNRDAIFQLVSCLQTAVGFGTGKNAVIPGRKVAGKTGTADQSKDIWFVGFTDDMTTAVWGGNDENRRIPGSHVTGGAVMAKIWKNFNVSYYKARPGGVGELGPWWKSVMAPKVLPLHRTKKDEVSIDFNSITEPSTGTGPPANGPPANEPQVLVSPRSNKERVDEVDPGSINLTPEEDTPPPGSRRRTGPRAAPQMVPEETYMPPDSAPPANHAPGRSEPFPANGPQRGEDVAPLHVPYESPMRSGPGTRERGPDNGRGEVMPESEELE